MALRALLGKVGFPLRAAALPKALNQSSRKFITDPTKFDSVGKQARDSSEFSIMVEGEIWDEEKLQKHIKIQNMVTRASLGILFTSAVLAVSFLAESVREYREREQQNQRLQSNFCSSFKF